MRPPGDCPVAALQIVALVKGLQLGALEEENIHFTVCQVKSLRPSAHSQSDIHCSTHLKFRDVGWPWRQHGCPQSSHDGSLAFTHTTCSPIRCKHRLTNVRVPENMYIPLGMSLQFVTLELFGGQLLCVYDNRS